MCTCGFFKGNVKMEKITLHPSERLDDLLTNDLKIIQSEEVFSFSMDAVLLARFCSVPAKGSILDLCTGNGVIPLLLSTRTKAAITGVEIQHRLYDMAARNVQLNRLDQQIKMVHGDLREFHTTVGHGMYDAVTVNPPYLPAYAGEQNINEHVAAARHEIYCSLEEVIAACSRLVKAGGKVSMVHRPGRLVDVLTIMRQYRLEPKRVRFVHPRLNQEANMVLVECLKDGKPDIRMLPPLIVYDSNHQYTPELMELYYGSK
jgi:tRNA1(Val) A37 N6-methylase TrmN6